MTAPHAPAAPAAPAAAPAEYVPAGAAAKLLHCSIDTVRRYADAGKIHTWRTPGNQRRFRVADLLAIVGRAAA